MQANKKWHLSISVKTTQEYNSLLRRKKKQMNGVADLNQAVWEEFEQHYMIIISVARFALIV